MGTQIVEILSPVTTFNNTDYMEDTRTYSSYYITSNITSQFSLTNPEYTSSIFLSYFPEFNDLIGGEEPKPSYVTLFDTYYGMANNSLDFKKFGFDWYFLMSSFIAHYITLSLQRQYSVISSSTTGSTEQLIAALTNIPMGVIIKENVGGEEVQTDNLINVSLFKSAGSYMLTQYGVVFWDRYYGYSRNFIRGVY